MRGSKDTAAASTEQDAYVRLDQANEGAAVRELQHPLPEQLAESVAAAMREGERIIFSLSVDMDLLGHYAQRWVVLTDRQCMTWDETEDDFQQRLCFPLDSLRDVRLREMTGNHMLFVDCGEGWQPLIRSSNRTSWKLKPMRQVLESVKEDGPASLEAIEDMALKLPDRPVCDTCGRTIHPRLKVCLACMNKRQLLGRMLRLLLPYRPAVALVLALVTVTSALSLVGPLILKWIMDLVLVPAVGGVVPAQSFWYRFGDPGSIKLLLVFGSIMLVMLLVPSAVDAVRGYVSSWIGNRIFVDLSNRVFAHIMRLSLSFYHTEETGAVMSRITRDVSRIHQFLIRRLQSVLRDVFLVTFIIVLMMNMNWRLAIIVLMPIPLLVLASEIARRKLHHVYHVLWRRYAGISRFLADVIPGIRVVKGFAQGRRETDRFEGIMDGVFAYEMRATKVRVILAPVFGLGTGIGHLLVYMAGGIMVIRGGGAEGAMTVGGIFLFTGLMWRFYGPMMDLAGILPEFERAFTSADRVFDILDNEPDLAGEDRTVDMPPIEGRVEFRDVTFGYEPDEPVLKEMNFVVQPGEMIGLVGHSGAGKTTLINMVCHFYKTDEGSVLIDGQDLAEVRVDSLREQIGIVSQEPFLFSGTIADNIAYGKPGVTQLEIIAAAKAANAHDFILKFPEGYDTLVGERGVRVSGGERQRVAIARAILRNPRILILDEATASVDTETEEKIQQALRRLIAGRTTFAIAHRLSTLKFADRLFVLDEGRLAESGTHDELIALGGIYARMCKKQTDLSRLTAWQE